ncbi:MAG TPA: hemolysin family protein [Chitinophagaceae bacterium]|nr:hemolysin family protein [Chitinophagaceae bacterium]
MIFIIITMLLVFLNGFFVAAEFAIVKVRASQIEVKVKTGQRTAILSKHIIKNLDSYLAATQLGITLASLGLGWIGEPVVSKLILSLMHGLGINISEDLAEDIALPVAFAIITILHIVFGELAPKSIAIQKSERTTLLVAYPLQLFYFVFKPFIWLLNGIANFLLKIIGIKPVHGSEVHSSDELKYIVEQGKESGAIEEANYNIIKNAFDFSQRTVRQVLIPRLQVVAIDEDNFNDEQLEEVIEETYSRIPCYKHSLDNVTGVVYLKDLLLKLKKNEEIKINELLRPIIVVPESKKIGSLLKEFQSKHQQLAVVVNEYGETEGIVTMEDILEELVGEIQDEYDVETPFVQKTAEKIYTVIASASINDINHYLPHPIEKYETYETLAGILIGKFNRLPNTNEKISFGGYEFTILKKLGTAILLVQLRDLE